MSTETSAETNKSVLVLSKFLQTSTSYLFFFFSFIICTFKCPSTYPSHYRFFFAWLIWSLQHMVLLWSYYVLVHLVFVTLLFCSVCLLEWYALLADCLSSLAYYTSLPVVCQCDPNVLEILKLIQVYGFLFFIFTACIPISAFFYFQWHSLRFFHYFSVL